MPSSGRAKKVVLTTSQPSASPLVLQAASVTHPQAYTFAPLRTNGGYHSTTTSPVSREMVDRLFLSRRIRPDVPNYLGSDFKLPINYLTSFEKLQFAILP